mgnify:CR=1 FL=1
MDVFIEQLTPYILERLANSYQTNEELEDVFIVSIRAF